MMEIIWNRFGKTGIKASRNFFNPALNLLTVWQKPRHVEFVILDYLFCHVMPKVQLAQVIFGRPSLTLEYADVTQEFVAVDW